LYRLRWNKETFKNPEALTKHQPNTTFQPKTMRFVCTFFLTLCFNHLFAQEDKGDLFRILSDEYSALTVRYSLLREAKTEILFSTYIIKSDEIGFANLKMLVDAAHRGVQVKVILDGLGNRLPADMLLYLADQGVQVKIFNKKIWTRPATIFRRMHGKMLIVDGSLCLVGGRNIDNEYFRMDSLNNFLDREVLIRGDEAVSDACTHFNAMWNHKVICTDLKGTFNPDDRHRCDSLLKNSIGEVAHRLPLLRQVRIPDTISLNDAMRPTVNPVHFVYPEFTYRKNGRISRPSRSDRRVTRELLKLIAAADSTLDIEVAYFLPTHLWVKALRAAHRRGVRIRVITNSALSNDVPLLQAIYSNRRNRYKRAGIELYEYCGSRMVHMKALTVDRRIALIGSYNLERKSEKFNTEVAAWVDDPFLAGKQESLFEKYLVNCQPYGGECPVSPTAFSAEQKKRKKKVAWMRWTLAPIVGLVL